MVVGSSALFVTVLAATVFYGLGNIFTPIQREFGWSSGVTAAAFSVRSQGTGIAAPLVGVMIGRVGPRITFGAGIAATVCGLLLLSAIQNIWMFYGSMALISAGVSSCGGQVGLVVAASWFVKRRATAMSVLTVGGGLSGFLVVPMAFLIDEVGWRTGVRLVALLLLAAGCLPLANVRFRPDDHPQPMDGLPLTDAESEAEVPKWGIPTRVAVRTSSFALLAVSMVGVSFAGTAIVVHQIPFMESIGISPTMAGTIVGVYTVSTVFGRLGFGILGDKSNKRVAMMIAMLMMGAGLLLMPLVRTAWEVMGVLLLIAPGFGGNIPLRSALIADYYGTEHFATINGISVFIQTFGAFLGPLVLGVMVDRTGHYDVGWFVVGLVVLLATPCLLVARVPLDLQRRYLSVSRAH